MKKVLCVALVLSLVLGACVALAVTDSTTKDVWIDNTEDNSVSYVIGRVNEHWTDENGVQITNTVTICNDEFSVEYGEPRSSEVQQAINSAAQTMRNMYGDAVEISYDEELVDEWDHRKYETVEDGDAVLIGDTDYLPSDEGTGDITRTHIASGDYGKITKYTVTGNVTIEPEDDPEGDPVDEPVDEPVEEPVEEHTKDHTLEEIGHSVTRVFYECADCGRHFWGFNRNAENVVQGLVKNSEGEKVVYTATVDFRDEGRVLVVKPKAAEDGTVVTLRKEDLENCRKDKVDTLEIAAGDTVLSADLSGLADLFDTDKEIDAYTFTIAGESLQIAALSGDEVILPTAANEEATPSDMAATATDVAATATDVEATATDEAATSTDQD